MSVISIIFDSIASNVFNALWIVGWIFYINHSTGIYSKLSELSTEIYVCNRLIDSHINTKETETDVELSKNMLEEKVKKLEEDIEYISNKLSKVKKMYIALSENVATLNDRIIDIEDELDDTYEEDEEYECEEEEEKDSAEDAKLLEKKYKNSNHNKRNKNKIE